MVDIEDLKSSDSDVVWVRVPLPAQCKGKVGHGKILSRYRRASSSLALGTIDKLLNK